MENEIKPRSLSNRSWYVIYTRARWEKKVDMMLKQQGITSLCPLKIVKNQWADRVKTVELPLFSSYVFVYINLKEELAVRKTYGVINFIYYLGRPAVIRDTEIENIKNILISNPDAEVVSLKDLSVGDRVAIKKGLLARQEGSIIKVSGKTVLMVFDHLECALVTRMPISELSLIS